MATRFPGAAAAFPGSRTRAGHPIDEDSPYPQKRIYGPREMPAFLHSKAYRFYMNFVRMMNLRVKNVDSFHQQDAESPPVISGLLEVLDAVDALVEATPLEENSSLQRFGNPAYRTWFAKMKRASPRLVAKFLQEIRPDAPPPDEYIVNELSTYLIECWGNNVRIDYGSGHELAFGFFLCSLSRLNFFTTPIEQIFVVIRVFRRYLDICRKIQTKFTLEPAGSHGVWGLDDFQFLPYLWGSSQILDHEEIGPKDILSEDIHRRYKDRNLYFDAIAYILRVKKGPFHEHSPILHSLTTCRNWLKINGGMIKMYTAEVLEKFVVVQHCLFGKLMPFEIYDDDEEMGV